MGSLCPPPNISRELAKAISPSYPSPSPSLKYKSHHHFILHSVMQDNRRRTNNLHFYKPLCKINIRTRDNEYMRAPASTAYELKSKMNPKAWSWISPQPTVQQTGPAHGMAMLGPNSGSSKLARKMSNLYTFLPTKKNFASSVFTYKHIKLKFTLATTHIK